MKRGTLLNPALSRLVATLGHGDLVVVADAGLPIPPSVERIDLAYAPGRPPFLDVLDALLAELEVERATVAAELSRASPAAFAAALEARLLALPRVARRGLDVVAHEELKRLTVQARAVVRTGEFTPYANVVLWSAVVF
ncbi:MAG TPA: D-ribose pyranase [Anaeromyxobacteraceae bacterium]|nr:D-ribose pyranase [Anaeromyxobacteraceae bacterium]